MSLVAKLYHSGKVLTDPRWWGFYKQRRTLKPELREVWAQKQVNRLPNFDASNDSQVLNAGQLLRTAGLLHLGELLDRDTCLEIARYFEQRKVHDPYRPEVAPFLPLSESRPSTSHIAHHTAADVVNAPHLLNIANDNRILETVAAALGAKPTISYMATWWSYATGIGAQHAEHFHRDVDDLRFFKLFVYLTDVDEKSGPHVYVQNSACRPELAEIRRFTDEEVIKTFGQENILPLTGKAGTAFLENTFGVHKGMPVQEGRRLVFQVVYSMRPLPYGPRKPVASWADVGMKLDPYINRVYLGS